MALFADVQQPSKPRRSRVRTAGWVLLVGALLGTFGFALVPAPYVIEQPGPVFNTLGKVAFNKSQVPLIDIPGQKTYATSGSLDMLTVNVVGNREQAPSWFEVAQAWIDPSKAVVPVDAIFPVGETVQESNKQDAVDMENSQKDAVAAALIEMGYKLPSVLTVGGFSPDSPSAGVLKTGDSIVAVDGVAVDTVLGLRAEVAKTGAGVAVAMKIIRAGATQTVNVIPALSTDKPAVPIIGIFPAIVYTYPFDVKIQLQNVGGPSAGQMFALGIIDKLTPGKLNGGENVAGTGTITADGTIGPIGGIRQKLYGARDAGATWFLAPFTNCNEVTGHIPKGITVLAVKTLGDSLTALKAISTHSSTAGLLSCPAG